MATTSGSSPDIAALEKQLIFLNQQLKDAGGLGIDVAATMLKAGGNADLINKAITEVKKRLEEITDSADYVYRTFQSITSEIGNQNTLLSLGKDTFRSLSNIAQDINYYQKGNTDLSEKQLKKLQNKVNLDEKELKFIERNLKVTIAANQSYAQGIQDKLDANEKISKSEKDFLKNYTKEVELLNNAQQVLDSGMIPSLQRELDISKEISNVRRDIAGLAGNAAKIISTFGGPLASFLNVSKAAEAVDEFSKRQIEGALNSKEVQQQLLEIEQEKAAILRKELDTIRSINADANLSDEEKQVQITNVEKKTREAITEQEIKASNIRKNAIKDTDNLINRFRALGIVLKELGVGLLKALTDPVTLIGLVIKLFKRAIEGAYRVSQNITNIGRALGVSSGLAGNLAGKMISSAQAAGGIFISAKKATTAIQQLTDSLGIAVQFSGKEIALQVQLTELLGLSADEAARLNKISHLTNNTASQFVTNVQKGAFAAMRANKIHLSDKQVLQDVSKLSAGILVKFQGNPKALGAAVVEARKLGISLEKLEGISDSLLDFQSSIEAELEAELLTGKQLNLEQARYAALTGDQATLMKEIAKAAGSYEDFSRMNVIAQRSLAKSLGMSRDEMSEMLLQQKMSQDYGEKANELNAQELRDLKRSGLTLDQYLAKQRNQMSLQERMNATQERIADTLDNKLAKLGEQLLGIVENLQKLLIIVIEELLGEIGDPMASMAEKIKHWTENTDEFREKIRAVKKDFKENLELIKNIAIAIGAIFVTSKAVAFFKVLRSGFKEIKGLTGGLGKLLGRTPTPPATPSIIPPTPPPPPPPPAPLRFTRGTGSYLQGGKAFGTGGTELTGAAKTSTINAAVRDVFGPGLKTRANNLLQSTKNLGNAISTGTNNIIQSTKNLPAAISTGAQNFKNTVGTGLNNAKNAVTTGANNLIQSTKNLPSAVSAGAQNFKNTVSTSLANTRTAIKVGAKDLTETLKARAVVGVSSAKTSVRAAAASAKGSAISAVRNPLQTLKGVGRFTGSTVKAVGKGVMSPVTTLGKLAKLGKTSGLLSAAVGGVTGFLETKERADVTKANKIAGLDTQLKEGKITEEEYKKQKGSAERQATGTAVGGGALRATAAVIGAGIGSLGGPIGTMIGGFLGDSIGGWINKKAPGVSERFGKMWDNISGKFIAGLEPWKKVIDNVQKGFNVVIGKINEFLKYIGIEGGLGSVFSELADIVGEGLMYPVKLLMGAFGALGDIFTAIGQFLSGDFAGMWNTLKNGFSDLLSTVFSPFTFVLEKIKKIFNTIDWSKLNPANWFKSEDKTKAPTGKVPTAAAGGFVTQGGFAKIDAGEFYSGANTKQAFTAMSNNIGRQTNLMGNYLPKMVDPMSGALLSKIMANSSMVKPSTIKANNESINNKPNTSSSDKMLAEFTRKFDKYIASQENKSSTPITLYTTTTLDGKTLAKGVAKYPDLPNGMRQSMSVFG